MIGNTVLIIQYTINCSIKIIVILIVLKNSCNLIGFKIFNSIKFL